MSSDLVTIRLALRDFDWSVTEPCRVFHGRGQGGADCRSINVDWLSPVLLITLYRPVDEAQVQSLIDSLPAESAGHVNAILLQRRYRKPAVFETLSGEPVSAITVTEAGLTYGLNFNAGLHTGLFLDMAAARSWVRERARDKRVLNLFAFTCAFSVAALAGGAKSVVNIDMSSSALAVGRDNHRYNGLDRRAASFLCHDLFRSWSKLRRLGPYDLVVVDPPSYQPGSFIAGKDYVRVVRQLPRMLADGADLLFCLNDPDKDVDFLRQLIETGESGLRFRARLDNPREFADVDPQRSLKVLHYHYPGK